MANGFVTVTNKKQMINARSLICFALSGIILFSDFSFVSFANNNSITNENLINDSVEEYTAENIADESVEEYTAENIADESVEEYPAGNLDNANVELVEDYVSDVSGADMDYDYSDEDTNCEGTDDEMLEPAAMSDDPTISFEEDYICSCDLCEELEYEEYVSDIEYTYDESDEGYDESTDTDVYYEDDLSDDDLFDMDNANYNVNDPGIISDGEQIDCSDEMFYDGLEYADETDFTGDALGDDSSEVTDEVTYYDESDAANPEQEDEQFSSDADKKLYYAERSATNTRKYYNDRARRILDKYFKPEDCLNTFEFNVNNCFGSNRYKYKSYSKTIKARAGKLVRDCVTDDEKCRAIHDWICLNIKYQSTSSYNGYPYETSASAFEVYKNKRGVCYGYAQLTQLMLQSVGVPCVIMRNNSHVWNAVYIDGEWKFIDNTFDAALTQNGTPPTYEIVDSKKVSYYYFYMSNELYDRIRVTYFIENCYGDVCFFPIYVARKLIVVRFDANGGELQTAKKVVYNDLYDWFYYPAATREGYEFLGWRRNGKTMSLMYWGSNLRWNKKSKLAPSGSVLVARWKEIKDDSKTSADNSTKKEEIDPNAPSVDDVEIGGLVKNAEADTVSEAVSQFKNDEDFKDSKFGKLRPRVYAKSKKSIRVTWKKINGADKYLIYAGKSEKKLKLVGEVSNNKKPRYVVKKLKTNKIYKFVVVALDVNGNVISTSKTVYMMTAGTKLNYIKSLKITNVKKSKLTIKKWNTYRIKIKVAKKYSKRNLKMFRAVSYESSNEAVATVDKDGKIKALSKGRCNIYVYTQSGICKKIKLRVK